MADIALTAAKIAPVFPEKAEIYDFVAGASITKGNAVYVDSNGVLGVADANDAAKDSPCGIALETVGSGQGVSVLKRGHVYGFTITQAYDAIAYLSNSAGSIADAAGSTSVTMGRVVPLSDNSKTKVLYIDCDW